MLARAEDRLPCGHPLMAVSNLSFSAQIDDWVRQTEQRATAVFRQSSQEVISTMQEAVPVDTGFLRASLQVGVNSEPVPADRPADGSQHAYDGAAATLAIAGAEIGDTVVASYSAKYAPHVEYGTSKMAGRGFVRLAVAQWQSIVNRVTQAAKSLAAQ